MNHFIKNILVGLAAIGIMGSIVGIGRGLYGLYQNLNIRISLESVNKGLLGLIGFLVGVLILWGLGAIINSAVPEKEVKNVRSR